MVQIETALPYIGGMESCIGGRNENQDSCGYHETIYGLLVIVCDGMGGGPSGKMASSMAVNEIIKYIDASHHAATAKQDVKTILKNAVKQANATIYAYSQENAENLGMGTTTVAMIINKDAAYVAHVGDSRCYQTRRGSIIFKTQDHSLVAELVRAGNLTEEQARLSPNSNVITKSLGINEDVDVEIDVLPYEKHDRFYLCSDGVWGSLPEKNLIKQLYRFPTIANVLDSTAILVDELGAQNGGHHDNHTLLIVETKTKSKLIAKMSTRDKRLMQLLAILLLLSFLINLIAIFSREHKVSEGYTIVAKDSIISSIKKERNQLEIEMADMHDAYIDSIESLKDEISILQTSAEKYEEQLNKLKEQIKENETREAQKAKQTEAAKKTEKKKALTGKLRILIKGKNDKKDESTLLGNLAFTEKAEGTPEYHRRRKNTLEQLKSAKENFTELGEEAAYNKLLWIITEYKKSDRKKVQTIVDELESKYK